MDKRDYGIAEAWRETMQVMESLGLLMVTADADGKPNVMTIGWATLGIVWSKPILTAYVRPSRFTYGLVDSAGDFTVNVPSPGMAETVEFCGTKSGRDHDKFEERSLTAEASRKVTSPVIRECLLHYECKVVHENDVDPPALAQDIKDSAYPQGDFHRIYFGEILAVYGVPDFEERVSKLPL